MLDYGHEPTCYDYKSYCSICDQEGMVMISKRIYDHLHRFFAVLI